MPKQRKGNKNERRLFSPRALLCTVALLTGVWVPALAAEGRLDAPEAALKTLKQMGVDISELSAK